MDSTSDRVYLRAENTSLEALLGRVDEELRSGRRVWVSGGPFDGLAHRFGSGRPGEPWVDLSLRLSGRAGWLYRARDVAAAAVVLLALSPLFAVLAVLVKLSSPGPVFYTAEVVGRGGRRFRWFKFRSMRPVAKEEDERRRAAQFRAYTEQKGAGYKVIDQSRVTPIGRWLRRYSLDELPQLINVLMGQMSLVGPRPCLPYEVELFPRWAHRRFDVIPGLTGVWQVCGRGRAAFEDGLAMDVYYVYARSFWLDLRLMLRTVAVVLKGQGAR